MSEPLCHPDMVEAAVLKLTQKEVPAELQGLNTSVALELASSPHFNINAPLKNGKTIGHIAALHVKWEIVTSIVMKLGYSANIKDSKGKSMLYYCLEKFGFMELAEYFGGGIQFEPNKYEEIYNELEIFLRDSKHLNIGQDILLTLIQIMFQQQSVPANLVGKVLTSLLEIDFPEELITFYTNVVMTLCVETSFDINTPLRDGMTIGHLAAYHEKRDILMKIVATEGFDPRAQDEMANTIPHYVCEIFIGKISLEVLMHCNIKWDFAMINKAELSVLEYYLALDTVNDPNVKGFLQKRMSTPVEGSSPPGAPGKCRIELMCRSHYGN